MDQITAIIIDDDEDVLDVFSEFLRNKNIKVLGCGRNGKEALDLYLAKKPDIVFLDLVMPQYDGLWAIEEIRKENNDAKIIVITGQKDYGSRMLKSLRPNAILYKPFEVDQLVKVIKKTMMEEEDPELVKDESQKPESDY